MQMTIAEHCAILDRVASCHDRPLRAETVAATKLLLPQFTVDAPYWFGLDGEGDLFVHWMKDGGDAYLSVEPTKLHLLIKIPGRPTVRIDDEPFDGVTLPPAIAAALQEYSQWRCK